MRGRTALFISFILVSIPFHPALASKDTTEYYAILIGMGSDDVKRLYDALLIHENWKENNIVMLINKNATIENVSRAFENVSSAVDKNDCIFILYCGDGVKMKDENGDEKDGYDEGLMLQNGNVSDDWLSERIDDMKAAAISIFLDCDFGNGIADDLKGRRKIILSSHGILPYHIPTKILVHEARHSKNATFEKIYGIVKKINNAFWLSLPFIATFLSTIMTLSPIILFDFMLNLARSIVQFFIDGMVGGISPIMYFIFFLITIKIYMPFFIALNGLAVINAISLIELFTFIKSKGFIFPFCSMNNGYETDMLFLKD